MKNNISNMSSLQIKILLLENNITQSEIARSLGVTPQTIWRVIDGRDISHRVRTAIAEAIGKDLKILWPSTYLYGGGPRKRGRPFSEETKRSRKRAAA